MPRVAPILSAKAVHNLKSKGFYAVGGCPGLHLRVSSTSARSWILRTTVQGQRTDLGLGGFPEVSLSEAREKGLSLRQEIRSGSDPRETKREARAAAAATRAKRITFEQAFERFFNEKQSAELDNQKHALQWRSTMQQYVFPTIGSKSLEEIDMDAVRSVLLPIWHEKTETATRVRQRMEKVFQWSIANGLASGSNPALWKGGLQELLPSPSKLKQTRHHPAVSLSDASTWFALLRQRPGMGARGLEFATLTAARSGEVRNATWDEIDLEEKVWIVPAERMKARREHRVPLSREAMALLSGLPKLYDVKFIFPSPRNGAQSDMTLSAVMKRIHKTEAEAGRVGFVDQRSGAIAVPHGIRSTFKDWATERTDYPSDMVEIALAHNVGSQVERAYRRGDMLEKRQAMMEDWAAFLTT